MEDVLRVIISIIEEILKLLINFRIVRECRKDWDGAQTVGHECTEKSHCCDDDICNVEKYYCERSMWNIL